MNSTQSAVFGSGCFWCYQGMFKSIKGVHDVTVGYAGGEVENPDYESVCTGETGHAEVFKVEFDPKIISYETLVDVFFHMHDATQLNKQGNDVGTQYRSVIFYTNDQQKEVAEKVKSRLENEKLFEDEIVTEITQLDKFYEAEEYHQDYFEKNPYAGYCQFVISPKMSKFREKYAKLLITKD
jgi:peptide-methionine (S)-S-oxide reductase